MSNRKRYTVLVGYPKGGGHWARKGEIVELLEVQAQQLETSGRIALVQDPVVEEVTSSAGNKKSEKAAD